MKKNKIVMVNISLPKAILDKFDKVAEEQHWSRSTLIRLAVEYYLQTHYLGSTNKQ